MKEYKAINEEKLAEVTGGTDEWGEKMSKYLPSDHGPRIGQYDAGNYVGQYVYVVYDNDREVYYWGKLLKSWEKELGCATSRTHIVHVDGANDYWDANTYNIGKDIEFGGENHTLFLMH